MQQWLVTDDRATVDYGYQSPRLTNLYSLESQSGEARTCQSAVKWRPCFRLLTRLFKWCLVAACRPTRQKLARFRVFTHPVKNCIVSICWPARQKLSRVLRCNEDNGSTCFRHQWWLPLEALHCPWMQFTNSLRKKKLFNSWKNGTCIDVTAGEVTCKRHLLCPMKRISLLRFCLQLNLKFSQTTPNAKNIMIVFICQ